MSAEEFNKIYNLSSEQFQMREVYLHQVALFDDRFKDYGIEFARRHGRAYHILSGSLYQDMQCFKDAESVTFLGERHNFSFVFLQTACSLGVPFGIITARDERQLACILSASEPFKPIKVYRPFLKNFFAGEGQCDTVDPVMTADIVILGLHGDALCASLGNAILCSRCEGRVYDKTDEKAPACVLGSGCFRKRRFSREKEVQMIHAEDLKAKAVVLNTCAGFALAGSKYGDFADLLPMRFMEGPGHVYVSSFLIKPSSIEEIYLFWALLRSHRSFARATLLFNQIRASRLGAEPSFVMLGDGSARMDDHIGTEAMVWRVEQAMETVTALGVSTCSRGTVYLSLDSERFPMITLWPVDDIVGFVDALAPATFAIHPGIKDRSLEVIVQFHSEYSLPFRIFLVPRSLAVTAADLARKRAENLALVNILRLVDDHREKMNPLVKEINRHLETVAIVAGLSEFDAGKYLMMQLATQQASECLDKFEILLSDAILQISCANDTHLVLNDLNVCLMHFYEPEDITCPECGNRQVTYHFRSRQREGMHIAQTVCPCCEIVAVSTRPRCKLRIRAAETISPGEKLPVSIEITGDIDAGFDNSIGLALIGSTSGLNKRKTVTGAGIILNEALSVPSNVKPGLYYLRGWLIGIGGITIGHKQLYVR